MNAIETAREALLAQLEPFNQEEAQLKERLEEIGEIKTPLEAALKALATAKKSKPKAERKASKPYARKADVHSVCLALVEANPSINKVDLEGLAKHKLSNELGFSLSGVSLRLGECLSATPFTVAPDDTVTITTSLLPRRSELPVDG